MLSKGWLVPGGGIEPPQPCGVEVSALTADPQNKKAHPVQRWAFSFAALIGGLLTSCPRNPAKR